MSEAKLYTQDEMDILLGLKPDSDNYQYFKTSNINCTKLFHQNVRGIYATFIIDDCYIRVFLPKLDANIDETIASNEMNTLFRGDKSSFLISYVDLFSRSREEFGGVNHTANVWPYIDIKGSISGSSIGNMIYKTWTWAKSKILPNFNLSGALLEDGLPIMELSSTNKEFCYISGGSVLLDKTSGARVLVLYVDNVLNQLGTNAQTAVPKIPIFINTDVLTNVVYFSGVSSADTKF